MGALFSLGRPWKKHFVYNWRFNLTLLAVLTCCLCVAMLHVDHFFLYQDDIDLSRDWREKIVGLAFLNFLFYAVIELVATTLIVRCAKAVQNRAARPSIFGGGAHKKDAKPYHRLREDFEAGWALHRNR